MTRHSFWPVSGYIFVILFTILYIRCISNGYAEENRMRVTIEFESVAEAEEYEIRFFSTDDTAMGDPIRVKKSPAVLIVSTEAGYLRIRSVGKEGERSPWSEREQIPRPGPVHREMPTQTDTIFRRVGTRGGRVRLFLARPDLPLSHFISSRPRYVTINGTSFRSELDALPFSLDGYFRVAISAREDMLMQRLYYPVGRADEIVYLEFWVDHGPPDVRLLMYRQQAQVGGRLRIGGGTRIVLAAKDPVSGIAKISYRIFPVAHTPGDYREYTGDFYIRDVLAGSEGEYNIEYFAEDHAGNVSLPHRNTVSVDAKGPDIDVEDGGSLQPVVVTVSDISSPVRTIVYLNDTELFRRHRNGPWIIDRRLLPDVGRYTLRIDAVDILNNRSKWQKTMQAD